MSLNVYNRKRKFNQTPEPEGKKKKNSGDLRFVVQMHHASRLHFDFRLEFDGVFKSWAVPKGPSLNPLDQRLAVFVEDHPLDYGSFEGIIPKGNYGAGTVMVWDEGTYVERGALDHPFSRQQNEKAIREGFSKGHITFVLNGHKLKGEFALIQLKKDATKKAWLLVKKRDEHSTYKRSDKLDNLSVLTGRSIEQIADESESKGAVWLPAKKRKELNTRKTVAQPVQVKTQKNKLVSKFESMPRKNKPMIATRSREIVDGKDWIFEPHVDGLRALSEVEGKRVHLYSKSGLSFEKKFPRIVEELKKQEHHLVLDGEIEKSATGGIYWVYDVLYCDGIDLRKQALSERKKILHSHIQQGKHVKILTHYATSNIPQAEEVVAKNLLSPYHSKTTDDWLIIVKAGKKEAPRIQAQKLASQLPRVKKSERPAQVVTTDEPRLTNLNKIFWPEEGITKGDLIEYYRSISSAILPYLKDRPMSLNRQPNGIAAPGFYQKDMTGYIPRWLQTKRIFSESANKSIDYVLCQDLRSLLYIVNLGCIEMNPWFSRTESLDKPDFLVIDLDPDGNDFDHVIEVALEVHDLLDKIGAKNFCKTSGATGLHIGVPTGAQYDFDLVREFAEAVCKVIARKFPASTSVERNPNRRRGKIYLDFMQNRRGQTLASAYCVRPRKLAPVSMPLKWSELKPGLRPEDFHIGNALERIVTSKSDPWRGVLGQAVDLKQCLKKLVK